MLSFCVRRPPPIRTRRSCCRSNRRRTVACRRDARRDRARCGPSACRLTTCKRLRVEHDERRLLPAARGDHEKPPVARGNEVHRQIADVDVAARRRDLPAVGKQRDAVALITGTSRRARGLLRQRRQRGSDAQRECRNQNGTTHHRARITSIADDPSSALQNWRRPRVAQAFRPGERPPRRPQGLRYVNCRALQGRQWL